MKKNIGILSILLLVLMLVLSGCTKGESSDVKGENEKAQTQETGKDQEGEKKDGEKAAVDSDTDKKPLTIVFKDGLPALSLAKMVDEKSIENLSYDMVSSPDALTAKVLNKEADFAVVPSNFASIAFNKDLGYKIAGVCVWGNTYIITDREDVKSLKDLEGKTLTSFAKGMTPDIITKFVLEGQNVDLSKIDINYLPSASEIAPNFIKEKDQITVAPEPVATMIQLKKPNAKVISNLNDDVKKLGMESGFPQAVLLVKSDLVKNNPEKVNEVISNYSSSIKWAKENKEDLAELAQRLDMKVPKEAIIKGLDSMNLGDLEKNSKDMYENFFEILQKENPKSIGGKIPADEAYYER